MLNLFRRKELCAAIILAAVLAGSVVQSYADTGSVRLKTSKVGFIVGVGGGQVL